MKLYRYGWAALFAAMAGDIILPWIFSLFYDGYSNTKMSISALGNPQSPVRLPFNIWMLIEGVLFLLSLPAVYRHYSDISSALTKAMVVFIAIFAVGACIFTCFFSVNESKDVVTTASKIHGAGSVIGFMLFLAVPLLIALLSFRSNERMIGAAGIVCFIASLIFFILFVMSDKEEFAGTVINNEGIWQRLNLLFMYLPLIIVSVKRLVK